MILMITVIVSTFFFSVSQEWKEFIKGHLLGLKVCW